MMFDSEFYIVCSICKERFKTGDVLLGQAQIVHQSYTQYEDDRSEPPVFAPCNNERFQHLDYFHVRCLG